MSKKDKILIYIQCSIDLLGAVLTLVDKNYIASLLWFLLLWEGIIEYNLRATIGEQKEIIELQEEQLRWYENDINESDYR